jgi:predicted permease
MPGWKRFFERKQRDGDFADELAAYVEQECADNIARGMDAREAREAALRKLGNLTKLREEIHRMNSLGWVESIWQDLRYGARTLRASPVFTIVAILSLALGIGANTAIFQLLDAVRLRNLPVKDPQQLAEIKIVGGNKGIGLNEEYGELTRPIWEEIRRNHPAFSGVFAWSKDGILTGEGAQSERVYGLYVSSQFFSVLGVQPWRGQFFAPSDEHACPETTAVVSYGYWKSKLGGRELGAGTTVLIDGTARQVIGVAPPDFYGLAVGERFDIALPFCMPKVMQRNVFDVTVMGRLKPGVSIENASAQLAAQSPGIMSATVLTGYDPGTTGTYRKFRLGVYSAASGVSNLRNKYTPSLWLLLAITGLILLIACANLANLMLARASVREREVGVRLAIGASRIRVLQQSFIESWLLAITGTVLGLALAGSLSRLLVLSVSLGNDPTALAPGFDWHVLLFSGALATLTCIAFGVAPAIRTAGADPAGAIRAGGRGMTTSRERFSTQRAMVITQISISLVLLTASLLFIRSFHNLMTFDPGMREDGITLVWLVFPRSHIAPDHLGEFKRELLEDVQSIPGVESAALTTNVPLMGTSWTHVITAGEKENSSKFTWVSSDYFKTLGMPILSGRSFNETDTATSQRVAVVNKTFVRRFFNGANPIGQAFRTHQEPNYPSTIYQIVGVIPDTKYDDIRAGTPPMTFAPATQFPNQGPWTAMMIRSGLPSATVIDSVKNRIAQKHPAMSIQGSNFKQDIHNGFTRERLMALLSGLFGILAAILVTVGLYGVVAYIVARRQNEFGIRIALGATLRQVVGLVLRESVVLLFIGIPLGLLLSFAAARAAASLLFGLTPYDPAAYIVAASLLAIIGVLASFLPAFRAAKVDPIAALKCE